MATQGCQRRCRGFRMVVLVLLLVLLCVSYVAAEESAVMSGGHAGGQWAGLVVRDATPCGRGAEVWAENHLLQKIAGDALTDDALNIATGPCKDETKKPEGCPVKCFRADPVCGTDKLTYWCGPTEAKCAGVDVAHDGYCKLWELDTNIGSTTALRAAQSLQLVHMLWLLVAGLFIVLGLP